MRSYRVNRRCTGCQINNRSIPPAMQTYLCSRDDPISALLLRAESIVWFPRIPRVTENQHLPTVNNVAIGNRHPLPATEVDNDLRSIGAWSDGVEANIRAAEAAATRAASCLRRVPNHRRATDTP